MLEKAKSLIVAEMHPKGEKNGILKRNFRR